MCQTTSIGIASNHMSQVPELWKRPDVSNVYKMLISQSPDPSFLGMWYITRS